MLGRKHWCQAWNNTKGPLLGGLGGWANHGNVCCSQDLGVVGPLPNGPTPWLVNAGNYNWDDPTTNLGSNYRIQTNKSMVVSGSPKRW